MAKQETKCGCKKQCQNIILSYGSWSLWDVMAEEGTRRVEGAN